MVKRVLVGYGIDVDAVSGWINTHGGAKADATNVSRGVFGATVGVDRLLKLWDKYGIKATWFAPAHTIESFPEQLAKVRDAGHEIALHGYSHEYVSGLSVKTQRDILKKSIEVATKFTGKKPKGWTAPAWKTSKDTIRLLEENGIEYDHSFMHHDSQLYYCPDGTEEWIEPNTTLDASTWMSPMTKMKPSTIVEVPANWHLDDWPPFCFTLGNPGTHGFVDTHSVERLWREQFDYFYREHDTFVFVMSLHPQISGKPQVILMHERLIEYIKSHEGVEWMTLEQMAAEFKAGKIGGVTVHGGV